MHIIQRGREILTLEKQFSEADWENIRKLKLPKGERLELQPDVQFEGSLDDVKKELMVAELELVDTNNYKEVSAAIKKFDLKPEGRTKSAYIKCIKDAMK